MRQEFHQASVINFAPPPFVQKVIAEHKKILHPATRDILSHLPQAYLKSEERSYQTTSDMLQIADIIQKFSSDSLGQNRPVPGSIYYALMVGHVADANPKQFPKLASDDYSALRDQMFQLYAAPELIDSALIGQEAKFAYRVELLVRMEKFLHDISNGSLPLCSDEAKDFYAGHVARNQILLNGRDRLDDRLISVTRQINYIINHYESEFCPYIGVGIECGEEVLDKDKAFALMPPVHSENSQYHFAQAYSYFEDLHDNQPYQAFYDFYERIIQPANLLYLAVRDVSPQYIDFIIADGIYRASQDPFEVEKAGKELAILHSAVRTGRHPIILSEFGLETAKLQSAQACIAITDLMFSSLKIWGSQAHLVFRGDEISGLIERLEETETLEVENPHLKLYWDVIRENTIDNLNSAIENNPDLAADFPPYQPPPAPI